jgi:hypothetical protein
VRSRDRSIGAQSVVGEQRDDAFVEQDGGGLALGFVAQLAAILGAEEVVLVARGEEP